MPHSSATHPEVKVKSHSPQLIGDKRGISGRLSMGTGKDQFLFNTSRVLVEGKIINNNNNNNTIYFRPTALHYA